MNIIGIVCEYNPFHLGHEYHINETRRMLGENCPVVAVMSGDFVQRGDAAVFSKFARAEAACRCGADLVMELPLPWALSSAEGFAHGAVSLLNRAGVTHLSFGSELGESEPLEELAEILASDEINDEIKTQLKKEPSLSYAAAREIVLKSKAGNKAELLRLPNNILAAEYLKAIRKLASDIKPVAVRRTGSGHDATGNIGPKSAFELRNMILKGEDIREFIPKNAAEVFMKESDEGRILDRKILDTAVMSRLRMFNEEYFCSLPDASEGLGSRIYSAVRNEGSLDEVCAAAKTKRYALTRLRRVCMCAALGLRNGMKTAEPPYARVLAANERGCSLLRDMCNKNSTPVITKAAAVNKLSEECRQVFACGASAHDFYVLCRKAENQRSGGMDWKTSPKIVKNI
ncbi:MAG: nucleotidyltransferase family protein [Candidatus Limivicinus sp.]|jgi:predicted nucleotidyltransferase